MKQLVVLTAKSNFFGTEDVNNAGHVCRYVINKRALPFSPLDYLHYSVKCVCYQTQY
jgi:hypothetical protein